MDKLLATGLGIGYIRKGGGTIASLVCCICLYLSRLWSQPISATITITIGLLFLGTVAAQRVERYWGKDNYRIVIDEIAGMWISMVFIPLTIPRLLTGLFLFRLLDIYKPLLIGKMEKLPGGTGVMMDDVLAGFYTNLLLQVLIKLYFL
jgi:phosphatidylglycerophosphatase A